MDIMMVNCISPPGVRPHHANTYNPKAQTVPNIDIEVSSFFIRFWVGPESDQDFRS